MSKNYILIVISFIIIAIFGPKVGEIITKKQMLRERKILVKKLMVAQGIERDRLKKINEAHEEVIRIYEKMTNVYLSPPPTVKKIIIGVGE